MSTPKCPGIGAYYDRVLQLQNRCIYMLAMSSPTFDKLSGTFWVDIYAGDLGTGRRGNNKRRRIHSLENIVLMYRENIQHYYVFLELKRAYKSLQKVRDTLSQQYCITV